MSESESLERLQYFQSAVNEIMGSLDERQQAIISARFGLGTSNKPKTYQVIGEEFGISKERVRQVIATALHKLTVRARSHQLELEE